MKEYLGNECMVIEEDLDKLLSTSGTVNNGAFWFQRTTAISASDRVTQIMMEKFSPLSILIFTVIVYLLFGSLWLVIGVFIVCFSFCRICRWLNSQILSKMWLYNVDLFSNRQKKSDCRWIWRDRTCVDIYTYCLLNQAKAVPSNLPTILLEQTYETSVAVILDRPQHIIEQHLKRRMSSPKSSFSMALVTRLILYLEFPVRASIVALKLVERWYSHMKIPVIKISQIDHQLYHDPITGDIQWNQQSIKILLENIERVIKKRELPSSIIDDSLIPWQTE